jgi:hypothetical protein
MSTIKDTLQYALLCEDIREEIGNKLSIMGLYTGDIYVGEFPASIRFAFLFSFENYDERHKEVDVQIFQDDEKILGATIPLPSTGTSVSILPQALVQFDAARTLKLFVSYAGEDGVLALSKRVSLQPILPAS